MIDIHKLITNVEKAILALIALFTVYVIILQGKGISTVDLIYEGGAVLLLALAALVLRYRPARSHDDAEDGPPQ